MILVAIVFCLTGRAQRFYNLTAEQVRIDSLLPTFYCSIPLGGCYADSSYTVTIAYPEFIDMSRADIERCQSIHPQPLPAMPEVSQQMGVVRKQGRLDVSFTPLVCRNGKYQKMVSFMLRVDAVPRSASGIKRRAAADGERYVSHSVLSSGSWAKIRVPSSGVYQLTADVVRQAGFSDLSKVKIYGYGGELQPEKLTPDYLAETDDLHEVPTFNHGGRRLFYAKGPVSWNSNGQRVRNFYSDYGYYFLTENDSTPLTVDSTAFLNSFYPSGDDYGTLLEIDDYAWYQGGRNLYDARQLKAGSTTNYTLESASSGIGKMTIVLSASDGASISVSVNDSVVGTVNISKHDSEHEAMRTGTLTCNVRNLKASNTVTVKPSATSGLCRLDYISIYASKPKAAPDVVNSSFPVPEYVYNITNQDHHADPAAGMVIIIPTSQKLLKQAQRLKDLHWQRDSLRTNIVPADELFNEFSSGTPDGNAYRRYLKMLYDRADTEADMPRYLVLLGDGAWDNRMRISDWKTYSVDDFLLCYESDNSYSHTLCYTSDDYFCMLDDNEGGSLTNGDKADIAVGRIPAQTAEEATIALDKIESYVSLAEAGSWQNTICIMGDDGNQDKHMQDADDVAQLVEELNPDFLVKRIMWDAYTRVSSSTGNSYPDVTRLIKQQMQQGALIMNYSGHGGPHAISHEYVLRLADFAATTSMRLPLWMTASCDIMAYDGLEPNIGETAFFNQKGGAIAFYGTTRTVYQPQNRLMNQAFVNYLFTPGSDGRPVPIGEAVRLAKLSLLSKDPSPNKLQYTLLGDPALRLAQPTSKMVVDSINGVSMSSGSVLSLTAGTTVTVTGRVLTVDQQTRTDFNGIVSAIVSDAAELITCKQNNTAEAAEKPFTFYDRPNTIYSGSDSVRQGRFSFTFVVPRDISYSDETGLITLYATNSDNSVQASGHCSQLTMNGTGTTQSDELGPSIYCYLNSASFTNGDVVNSTPYFVAELNDEDGINSTGSGIGHDLQLIIDGEMAKTYSLNDYFQYDFGSYTRGTVGFSIPELAEGQHQLLFRAWDVMNNSSTAQLTFTVARGQEPLFLDMDCTPNPATERTTFRVVHDRANSPIDVVLDIFDTSGRHLWSHSESLSSTGNTLTIDWNLCTGSGHRLGTGLYLYRIRLSSEGSTYTSKSKKLIIL